MELKTAHALAALLPAPTASYEEAQKTIGVQGRGCRHNVTERGTSPLAQLLQGPAAAHDEIISQQLQLFPALADPSHPLHMVVEALIDQLQVDQRLVTDLGEELQSLLANLGQREAGGGHAPRSSSGGLEGGLG